ncbi:MAG: poly(A) polymerase [Myxococcota bacterium]
MNHGEEVSLEESSAEEGEESKEIDVSRIDLNALWVIRRLRARGYEAYLTGGCVRDLLLGQVPKDFDVATSAKPSEIRSVFSNCRLVGRRFLLAHVYFPGGRVIETATFRAAPDPDAAGDDLLLRRDNVYGTLQEDALRRDLTINGLFYDPIACRLIDFVGGRQDLREGVIRSIGDPDVRMQEDPVRMIRAVRFACRLGFHIEQQTLQAIQSHAGAIVRCAPARLQEELLGLLRSGLAAPSMMRCRELGLLSALLPELTEALECPLQPGQEEDKPSSPEERLGQWQAVLQALDRVRHKGVHIDAAVAFATLLLPIYLAFERSDQKARIWLEGLCMSWGKQVRLVRRDQELLRFLLESMAGVFVRGGDDDTMKSLVHKVWFRQVLLLRIIHLCAQGESLDEVKKWKEAAHREGRPYTQEKEADRKNRQQTQRRYTRTRSSSRRRFS